MTCCLFPSSPGCCWTMLQGLTREQGTIRGHFTALGCESGVALEWPTILLGAESEELCSYREV